MSRSSASTTRFYGWKLAILLFFAMAINTALPIYGLGLLNVHMADELGFNRATLGTAFAVFMLMTGLPGPLTAKLIDAAGIRWTLVTGNLMLLIGAVAMATVATSPFLLILFAGVIIGSSSAIGGPISIQASVTRWFSRRRALAMGIVLAGGSVTGMVFPPLLEHFVSSGGWRSGWWLVASLAGLVTLAIILFFREYPEDIGQTIDGYPVDYGAAEQHTPARLSRVYQTDEEWTFRDVIRSKTFWLLLACSTGVSAVYTIFHAQAVLQIRDLGFSTQTAAYLISMSVAAGFVAHALVSFLGDRIDPKKMWAASLLSQGIGIGLFAGGGEEWLLYPAIICVGIGNSGAILSLIMTFSNWFGARAAPFVFGFGSAFSAACGALAPIAAGYSYDISGSFAPVFYGISVTCTLVAALLWLTRPPRLAKAAA
jgi:MFS family permease